MIYRRLELAEETRGMAQDPMPARDFMNELNEFLPWNETTPMQFRKFQPTKERLKKLTDMATASEAKTYELFVSFSGWPFDLKPEDRRPRYPHCVLQWNDSYATPDKFCDLLSVDVNAVDVSRPTVRRCDVRKLDFANVETHTEMKPKVWDDPYCDGDAVSDGEEDDYEDIEQYEGNDAEEEQAGDTEPLPDEDYPFDNNTLRGQRTHGQICAYAGATMTMQFWTHLFTVLIFSSYGQLLWWDHSSVIASRRFNDAEHPLILFRFYKRFAQLTLAQRGRDRRISIPTKVQGRSARAAFKRYAPGCWRGKALDEVREEMSVNQLALVRLTVGSGSSQRVFIIGAPSWHQGGYSPFGRATRHGMAYCVRKSQTLFYKDYWREDAPHTIPESEVYQLLAKHEIPHVAEMKLGGDSGFETMGHSYGSKVWARAHHRIRHLIGHLIVLVTKGRPLESSETAKQLVSCLADAMEAHQKAYELAGILHWDISVGNIMMTLNREDRRGILIDWDHCVLVSHGTWQFISAHLLDNPNAEHTVVDDRESALYVLVWVALRNLRHSLPPELLKDTLSIFDMYVALPQQRDVGGRHKRNALISDTFSGDIGLKVPGLEDCLTELCETFAFRYKKTAAATERALQQKKLAQLEKPCLFYETLRAFAEDIEEPSGKEIDWCDNVKLIREAGRTGRQKRGLSEKHESQSKHFRGYDGTATPAVSLDNNG
ncbi:uncharacterized protein BT62DRAFT_933699 [Guyanagaster necrorhizus]|uniref:Fungal-type protein kinase domain-containing protein n=1 Tax=Guyanagaster necrorhizus TaxID=856835 RepID=A0A9P7VNW7_9AGAR|nr:uncharacterized protein BT62DRAFT_933699 [Guyanagaster necrorhizus MCA 3950]KAG7444658.1 hypothetical protein BT62DRAFT_933699 [Guyanagaster necrorhizus MCA 3950]